jgi:phage shock protein A
MTEKQQKISTPADMAGSEFGVKETVGEKTRRLANLRRHKLLMAIRAFENLTGANYSLDKEKANAFVDEAIARLEKMREKINNPGKKAEVPGSDFF